MSGRQRRMPLQVLVTHSTGLPIFAKRSRRWRGDLALTIRIGSGGGRATFVRIVKHMVHGHLGHDCRRSGVSCERPVVSLWTRLRGNTWTNGDSVGQVG